MAFEDEESDAETQAGETSSLKLKENWDLFDILPPDKDSDLDEDRTVYNFILRTLKLITYIVTFGLVLFSSIVSKSTTVLMTSQLRKYEQTIPFCNPDYGNNLEFLSRSTIEERISWVWALYFCFMFPEAQSFLRSLRILFFKGQDRPTLIQFIVPLFFETLHTIGLALFIYLVLPTMDAVKAVMLTNAMCIIPGILSMLSRGYDKQWVLRNVVDIFAIIFQLSALFVWPLFAPQKADDHPWLISLSVLLISCGWWENFVEPSSSFVILQMLGKMKVRLRRTRYYTYTFVSLFKMGVFLGMLVVCTYVNENSWSVAFDTFLDGFKNHTIVVSEKRPPVDPGSQPEVDDSNPFLQPGTFERENVHTAIYYTMGTQMVSTYICYVIGKLACRILIQVFSFSFPVLLSVPATIAILVSLCGVRTNETCFMDSIFPGYLWWSCPTGSFWDDYFYREHAWVWILWILSQTWITIHIWNPNGIRLAKTESVFATPMYNAFLVDQTLALNRRRDENDVDMDVDDDSDDEAEGDDIEAPIRDVDQDSSASCIKPEDKVPKIIACATMWHETKDEMIEMLKSIFRMDADQSARAIARRVFEFDDPDYYEFETHIFFDDAFELIDKEDADSPVIINAFVRDMISQMEEAATHVHQVFVKLRRPKKVPTPYGGRLEWILPGRTKLTCHIKDKNKIRHKKRWSQVMYMYYLLGYRLTYRSDLELERKEMIAQNTFLLALDGDIDFQPKAVELLVDLMKKNRNLGAACGRIHPIGSGPMVWYQKFEYAVGHWFQKATEHVFGCVLCSPGCFSLFRAKALMDYNVAKKYTTMATEPRHYVQYDQGEDRWLCTLLLQRGWRVEYSAASDSKTHAPEGFREFYNQRRRWAPSTMANIMDLLMDGRKIVKQNPDISYPYILYQMFLMVGSILGPGTIFLMLVGAFAVAFKLSQWTSFFYNFIPILAFILVCFFCKANIQLAFAEILTTIYALAMVAVVVAIILQITEDGWLAPSSLFLFIVASSFIIAGIVHPLEFGCLPHGFTYYITIPSMYLLLIIYSMFNLNVVSWGTREGAKVKTKQELEADAKEALEEAKKVEKKKKKGILGGLLPFGGDGKDKDGSIEFSCAGLFKLMCCVKDKSNEQEAKLDAIMQTVSKLEKLADKQVSFQRRQSVVMAGSPGVPTVPEEAVDGGERRDQMGNESVNSDQTDSENTESKRKRDDLMNPVWMEDKDLASFDVDFLTGPEIRFWRNMIDKYLLPLDADKKKEKAMAKALIDLRNKVAFTFIMCNAVFVVLIFLLQLEKENIHINWPLGAKVNVTYVPRSTEVNVSFEYLELEPIGLAFVAVFGLVLGIQFIGMLIHRLSTFLHIMALTVLDFFNNEGKSIGGDDHVKEGIGLIRKLQKARIAEFKKEQEKIAKKSGHPGRRKTIAHMERQNRRDTRVHDLNANFHNNFKDPGIRRSTKIFQNEKNRQTFMQLAERRNTVLGRRSSVVDRNASFLGDTDNSLAPSVSNSHIFNVPPPVFNRFSRNNNGRPRHPTRNNSREQFEMRQRRM